MPIINADWIFRRGIRPLIRANCLPFDADFHSLHAIRHSLHANFLSLQVNCLAFDGN